ncbi:pre-mRNA processing RNA-helicase [Saitoella coloradoensis]
MARHRSRTRTPDSASKRHRSSYDSHSRDREREYDHRGSSDRRRDGRGRDYTYDDRDRRRDRDRYDDRERAHDDRRQRDKYDDRRYRASDRDHRDRDRDRDRRRDYDRDDRSSRTDRKSVEPSRTTPLRAEPELQSQFPKPTSTTTAATATPTPLVEDDKIRQRRERLEAWKKKKAEEAAAAAAATTTAITATATTTATTSNQAETKSQTKTTPPLVNLAPESAAPPSRSDQVKANFAPVAQIRSTGVHLPPSSFSAFVNIGPPGSSIPSQGLSGFGIGMGLSGAKKSSGVKGLSFDDDEGSTRKLAKLPSFDLGEEYSKPDVSVEQAEGEEMEDVEQTQIQTPPKPSQEAEEEDEDIDPLDAFMNGLETKEAVSAPESRGEAIMSDDDGAGPSSDDALEAEDILAMAAKKAKKKELPNIDHSAIDYEPFRKEFYVEPAELREMTEEEVDELRLELDGIKIRGVECPKPVQKWSQCGLSAAVLEAITRLGYEKPTSIQAQAIPAIMSGRDVIGVAKTGSGKTIAFLLPMFRHIKDQRPLEASEGPIGIVMTPTRELAVQIHRECKPFLKALGLRAVCAYGGSPIKDQIADLKRGAEIIVCTPGRMIDLLGANAGRVTNLRRATYLVLDEADRMFDMGFEPQVMKIVNNVRPQRQTILFSATFPKQMEALARKILQHRPVEITVGARSVVAPEITQIVEVRDEDTKFFRTLELLGNLYNEDEDARTLIFVEKQESADLLLGDLMKRGYPCMSIHGGKDQVDRDSAILDFKNGVVPILVATSVAARGLDVKQLKLVINYDCPNHMEDYVHRVGRTGRAGNTGTAVTFITPSQDRYAVDIAKALRLSKSPIPVEVKSLADQFGEKVKAGTIKAAGSGSGFGGKGLERFDKERDMLRKMQRKVYGEEDGEEEEGEGEEDEETKKRVEAAATVSGGMPVETVAASTNANGVVLDAPASAAGIASGAAVAGIGAAPAATADKKATKNAALDKALAAIANINSRLKSAGQLRSSTAIDPKATIAPGALLPPDAGEYRAILEINDFPQKARWAVTNRTNIAKVLDATGVSITTKGQLVPKGESAPVGSSKLYLLVEGESQISVEGAMKELKRLLTEGTVAAIENEGRGGPTGRYSVL